MFIGEITDRGPAGEPGFTDERYWVRWPDSDPVEAINVAEVIGATHQLLAGQRVFVTVNLIARPSLRHTFFARPADPA